MQKTIYISPIMDTFIDSYLKNKNFSNQTHYFLGHFKSATKYRILLKFDLSSIPKNCNIINAKLTLFCIRNDYMEQENTFSIHPITKNWNYKNVNYLNQPKYDKSRKIQTKINCHLCEPISWDITEYAREWLKNPRKNFGIIIKAENEKDKASLLGLCSQRHNNKDWRPKLEITFTIKEKREIYLKPIPKIAIVTPQFFEWDGNRCLFGGGERYLIDLAKLLQKLGYEVDVFQPSIYEEWERTYEGIKIKGIGNPGFHQDFFIRLNKMFYQITKNYDYHIYFNMDVTYPHVFPNSICISHGIWWDSSERQWWRSKLWYSRLFQSINAVDLLVSVDTNTINWLNAVNPNLKCKKVYIPNYVDLETFKPSKIEPINKKYIKILYPRRLHPGRGWTVCKNVAVELVNEYDNIIFSFVGRGDKQSEKHMKIFASKHPRIEYTWYEMNEMYKAYKEADIVLIPSLYSEGTSLSLLEGMACGKPIIAGLVGGLTDLIIHGYNGYLIEINKENLKNAIIKLINNPELRKDMGKNARKISEHFSKKIWEERWKKIILQQFPIN
ncbi:DNRLRE domain-containing protein [Caloranaerobacter azorensis]|uniref:DNRLRE domain-containing protein n=1 Tax=Caloranaerobacter azorensis TaxID=116090 RepID=UPI00068AF77A|nr:DNRLRE domain-containing protein [Caloranaerobacter azorensis]